MQCFFQHSPIRTANAHKQSACGGEHCTNLWKFRFHTHGGWFHRPTKETYCILLELYYCLGLFMQFLVFWHYTILTFCILVVTDINSRPTDTRLLKFKIFSLLLQMDFKQVDYRYINCYVASFRWRSQWQLGLIKFGKWLDWLHSWLYRKTNFGRSLFFSIFLLFNHQFHYNNSVICVTRSVVLYVS